MSFKNKNNKKIHYDTKVTLESKHNNFINNFIDINKITKMEREITNLETKLSYIKDIETEIQIKDRIIYLNDEINNYKLNNNNTNEIEYFLDNGNIIFDYFDTKKYTDEAIDTNTQNPSHIMSYFNKNSNEKKNKGNSGDKNKKHLLYNFLLNTKENYQIDYNDFTQNIILCSRCNINKIVYMSEGKQICPQCGEETFILIESDKPSYKDPPREITYFSYKRINHFNEWLEQFQAKETTDIPKEIYELILIEIKKERIDINRLKSSKLRHILKKIGKNKYYEHIPHILNKLNGKSPPIMSIEIEEELRRMFKEIQIPFHKFCPKNRKNFLSYSYVLHKFVELLGLKEFSNSFLLLKSREKLHQQDIIWKNICNYLNWDYYSSI
tara:strand:+ start:3414 stop:4562 length:1149 start_codon:yes stop_codon:yes gene_type:complete